jgi:glycosyltransferase involved in cell wall biosynthesis
MAHVQGKIRILECIRQGKIGGGESHLLSLMENIDRSVFDPVVLSFTEGPMVDRLRQIGIPTHIIHTEKPFDFTKWGRVRKMLEDEDIRLIHAHGTRAASNTIVPARKTGTPLIYTIHGWSFHPDQNTIVRKLRTAGEQYLVNKSSLNISVAASNQESGRAVLKNFRSVVVNNGIDLKKFNPANSFPDIRAELGIPANSLLITFIARFTEHKQPLVLLNAFRQLSSSFPHVHLLMVGEGDQREEALKLTAPWPEKERIHFHPFRQDVPAVLAASDIFVLPSLWEGLPIGLLEAMAMGKAVVVTNVDGSREIVSHEKNGLMVQEAGNVKQLSEALIRLIKDEQLLTNIGNQAINTVTSTYDAQLMTRRIEEYYRNVIRDARKADRLRANETV